MLSRCTVRTGGVLVPRVEKRVVRGKSNAVVVREVHPSRGVAGCTARADLRCGGKVRCRANRKIVEERDMTRLYHLPSDPKQESNIADTKPDQLLRMQKLMIKKLEEIDAPPELITRFGLDKI